MSRSRVVFAAVSRQLSAQHGIDECIVAILLLCFPTQQAAAAGKAVRNLHLSGLVSRWATRRDIRFNASPN